MTSESVARSYTPQIFTDSIFKQPAVYRHGLAISPRLCARGLPEFRVPLKSEGAGNAGCALHRRSRVQNCKKNAHEHTGSAEAIRHSPRNGFTAYFVLSPVTRLV